MLAKHQHQMALLQQQREFEARQDEIRAAELAASDRAAQVRLHVSGHMQRWSRMCTDSRSDHGCTLNL